MKFSPRQQALSSLMLLGMVTLGLGSASAFAQESRRDRSERERDQDESSKQEGPRSQDQQRRHTAKDRRALLPGNVAQREVTGERLQQGHRGIDRDLPRAMLAEVGERVVRGQQQGRARGRRHPCRWARGHRGAGPLHPGLAPTARLLRRLRRRHPAGEGGL